MNKPNPLSARTHAPDSALLGTLGDPNRILFGSQIHIETEKVPYQDVRIEYEEKEVLERVPVERTIVEYTPVKRYRTVPKEKVIIDYYAVQHQVFQVPRIVPEKRVELVMKQVPTSRVEYVQVTRDVVHLPDKFRRYGNVAHQANTYDAPVRPDFRPEHIRRETSRIEPSKIEPSRIGITTSRSATRQYGTPQKKHSPHQLPSTTMSTGLKRMEEVREEGEQRSKITSLISQLRNSEVIPKEEIGR